MKKMLIVKMAIYTFYTYLNTMFFGLIIEGKILNRAILPPKIPFRIIFCFNLINKKKPQVIDRIITFILELF